MSREPDFYGVEPDFYGFWGSEGDWNPNNIFFMKLDVSEGERVSGKIIDKFGKSHFWGVLDESKFNFKKKYNPTAMEKGSLDKAIEYSSNAVNEFFYEGRWEVKKSQGNEGEFMIQPFPKSEVLFKIYASFRNKLDKL